RLLHRRPRAGAHRRRRPRQLDRPRRRRRRHPARGRARLRDAQPGPLARADARGCDRAGLPGRPAPAPRPRALRADARPQGGPHRRRDPARRGARLGEAHGPRRRARTGAVPDPVARRPRPRDRARAWPDRHRPRRRGADPPRRRGGRRSGARPREDRGRRAAPRHRPARARLRARVRTATGRARLDGGARRTQRRRRRDERRGDGVRRPAAREHRRRHRRRRRRARAGRAAAAGRRPALGRTARRRRRPQPRARRGRRRARLQRRGAVPAPLVPRPLRDPGAEDHRPRPHRRRPLRARAAGGRVILANAWLVTMDDAASEHERGWLRIEDGRIAALGPGDPPAGAAGPPAPPPAPPTPPPWVGTGPPASRQDRRTDSEVDATRPPRQNGESLLDLRGAVVTPGLVNTHHHLYQTLTRAHAQQADLFGWLRALYPIWARIDAEMQYAAARTGLAELALSGCSTVFDHHYVFPRGVTGLLEAELAAARELGLRFVASRGSMDLGVSDGGLPPDELAEDLDAILADTERVAALADGDLVQIAVAPCSPFSVTTRLMQESAELARRLGLRLHTHLAETLEEEQYC